MASTTTTRDRATPLWSRGAEFVAFYLSAPLVLALALPPDAMLPLLLAVTLVGVGLLAWTPGFRWSELTRGWGGVAWAEVAAMGGVTAAVCAVLVWLMVPQQALMLPRSAPGLWLMIMVLYPLLSALPQEVVFRPLFFRRYGGLFPDRRVAVLVNAMVFALAHLMFWNWVALALSLGGGLIFARGYLRGGFPTAVALHAVCGAIVFTSGIGSFFYHGAVPAS